MDVAEASFRVVMDSISFEFNVVNTDVDTGTPSNTIRGAVSADIEPALCSLIDEEAEGSPESV